MASLAVDIGQIGKGSQGPEVLAKIADAAALDFTFFPGRRYMASTRVKVVLTGEGQKARVEAHQGAFMFGYSRQQVVIEDLTSHPGHEAEGMLVAAQEGFETLAMSELHIEAATMALHQTKGVEPPRVTLVIERPEMP